MHTVKIGVKGLSPTEYYHTAQLLAIQFVFLKGFGS
jgi:hypothetical protein